MTVHQATMDSMAQTSSFPSLKTVPLVSYNDMAPDYPNMWLSALLLVSLATLY
jgi:hypothetical protein